MNRSTIFFAFGMIGATAFVLSFGCTKKATPPPPIHDTTVIIKKDTVKQTDTLYATKPDPTVNLTKGLLLYLPFSGNIADSSGNNNPTSAVGSVLTTDTHGYANNAFGATGVGGNQKIYVTNNGSIQFDTAYTVSLDFMARTVVRQSFISMVNPTNGMGPTFNIGWTVATSNYLAMGAQDTTQVCGTYGDPHQTDTTTFTPDTESWYNLIGVFYKGTIKMYINGQLISTKTGLASKALLCPNSKIVIGAWWDGDPQNINGKLDNVRLYNRVLTPHEIVELSKNYQVTSTRSKMTYSSR